MGDTETPAKSKSPKHGSEASRIRPLRQRNLQMDAIEITAESGEVVEVPLRVNIDPENLQDRSTEISFHLEAVGADLSVTEYARFLGAG